MKNALRSAIYRGEVMHRRLQPFGHRFRYRIFSMLIDLEELQELGCLRLFSHNKFNLFSFHDCDHGARDGTPLRPWIERQLAAAGIYIGAGRIEILCFPRVLGYVFNPLSVWFCREENGDVRAVLYEVCNTFGEHHSYLMPVETSAGANEVLHHACTKSFHVSPFVGMDYAYEFRTRVPDKCYEIGIRERSGAGPLLLAAQTAKRSELSDGSLLKCFFAYPLMTVKVVAAIHFEAFRLWLKGARYHEKPSPPTQQVEAIRTGVRTAAE